MVSCNAKARNKTGLQRTVARICEPSPNQFGGGACKSLRIGSYTKEDEQSRSRNQSAIAQTSKVHEKEKRRFSFFGWPKCAFCGIRNYLSSSGYC